MKKLELLNWIWNPFQDHQLTGMSTKASEQLIDLSEDSSLKYSLNRKQKFTKFWLSVAGNYPCLFDEAMKVLPFTTMR